MSGTVLNFWIVKVHNSSDILLTTTLTFNHIGDTFFSNRNTYFELVLYMKYSVIMEMMHI